MKSARMNRLFGTSGNCLDVAIITAPEKRTQKTKDKLKTVAGRVLDK